MKRTNVVVITLAVVMLAAGMLAAAAYVAGARTPGTIELGAAEIDLGTIPNTAAVTRAVPLRNVGGGPLEIVGISSSCGCTSALVDSTHLEPGQETALRVTFDPQAHDGALGQFMRQVYVRSNDPAAPEAVLTLRVNVVAP